MFYTKKELIELGLKSVGQNVLLSKKCSIYSPENISLGSNVRIDDFSIISASGSISIGNYVHIGAHSILMGEAPIRVDDFCGISGRVSVYSTSDDYSGLFLTNPMVPKKFRGLESAAIHLQAHAIIGAGSIVLPGANIGKGVAIGAMSLVRGEYRDFEVHAGNPTIYKGKRQKRFLKYEAFVRLGE